MQIEIEQEVAAMRRMTTGQLREYYAKVIGEESRSNHKTYLIRRIAWRLQAKAEGDLSIRARRRAEELARDAEFRVTPPKNMPLPAATGAIVTLEVPASHDQRLGGKRLDTHQTRSPRLRASREVLSGERGAIVRENGETWRRHDGLRHAPGAVGDRRAIVGAEHAEQQAMVFPAVRRAVRRNGCNRSATRWKHFT